MKDENRKKEYDIMKLNNELTTNPKENENFNIAQLNEIKYGIENGLKDDQIKIYKNTNYNEDQMREIRLGLEQGIDVRRYLNKNLHRNEMRRIRKMLYKNK